MSSVNGIFLVLSPTLLFFCEVYEEVLTECVLKYPKKYAYPVTSVPMVACKMKWAFNDGTFHHSGMAIRKTCKAVGIKPTRREMLKYFRPNTPYLPIAEHMLNPLSFTHG